MYFLGIDIAKTNHVASIIDSDGKVVIKTIRFTNSVDGYNNLISQVSSVAETNEIMVAMEATGHYWLSLFSYLIQDGYNVSVYNPFQIKAFRGAFHNRKQKNDVIDAVIIASYLRTFGSENTTLPNDYLLSLKQLTRFRTNLVDNISALKIRPLLYWTRFFLSFLLCFLMLLEKQQNNFYFLLQHLKIS